MKKLVVILAAAVLLSGPLALADTKGPQQAVASPDSRPEPAISLPAPPIELNKVPVTAVAPTATTFSVDVTTLVTGIFGLLGAVITAFVPFIAARIMGVMKISQDSALAGVVESALRNGLNLGLAKAQAASKDWTKVTVHNEVLADALTYVNAHAGEEAAKLGITRSSIQEKLESRLAAATNTANNIPTVVAAVPPAS